MLKLLVCVSALLLFIASLNATLHGKRDLRTFRNSKVLIGENGVKLATPQDELAFFVIGDWGGLPVFPFRTIIENSVSKQMTSLAKEHNTHFQLALGDNFYFNGVHDLNDRRFVETYETVFNSDYLRNTSWFALLGNHDHYGNASAQVEYTKKSKRWILPDFNYTISAKINDGLDDLVKIIMLDTVLLCGNSGLDSESDKAPKFKSLNDFKRSKSYFDWLENELLDAQHYPYIIVAGHFPVWSIAEHGPTQCLLDRLRPLLHKYKVSAYMCGHDHNLQHISDEFMQHRVEYLLSGASNFVDNSTQHADSIPAGSLRFHWADTKQIVNGGFGLAKLNAQQMKFSFYESNGKELYQTVLKPRI